MKIRLVDTFDIVMMKIRLYQDTDFYGFEINNYLEWILVNYNICFNTAIEFLWMDIE